MTHQRISRIVERWLLIEPLLLAAWTSHRLIAEPRLQTLRVQRGRIEYNPRFIDQLSSRDLEATLRFEALRILLKHPYSRRKSHTEISYAASNLTLQEYLQTDLPFPRSRDIFDDPDYDRQYFEFYYQKLLDEMPNSPQSSGGSPSQAIDISSAGSPLAEGALTSSAPQLDKINLLQIYVDPDQSGVENANLWDQDELLVERLDDLIRTARDNDSWGSISGQLQEQILANLHPKLDYRGVLRRFRTSILSQQRRLTRMRPNRRYGFTTMGSCREFSTRLLFAVDVSGSMNSDQLKQGFSLINHFFNYGVPSIDVIQFDAQITAPAITLRKAQRQVELKGRGGTNFNPIMTYIDHHPEYDGLIIYTDGFAPCPDPPHQGRTRLLWIFVHESSFHRCYPSLRHLGQGVYLKSGS